MEGYRTIITQVLTLIVSIAASMGVDIAGVDAAGVANAAVVVLTAAGILFKVLANKREVALTEQVNALEKAPQV